MREWEHIWERAGLLEIRDARGDRGIRWRLLDGRPRYDRAIRGYSSDGVAIRPPARRGGRQLHRLRETRSEIRDRRVRPYCRRVGNNSARNRRSVPRFELGRSSHFAEKSPPSGLEGSTPLKGCSPPPDSLGLHAGGGTVVDTPDGAPPELRSPGQPASGAAVRKRERQHRYERWVPEIDRELLAVSPGARSLADPAPIVEALCWLQRSMEAMARHAGAVADPDDAAVWLAGLVRQEVADRQRRGLAPIRSLGWFRPLIRRQARLLEVTPSRQRRDAAKEAERMRQALLSRCRMLRQLAADLASSPEVSAALLAADTDLFTPEQVLGRPLTVREEQLLQLRGWPRLRAQATAELESLLRPRRDSGARYTAQ